MDIQDRLGAPVTASFANAVVNEYQQAKATDSNLSTSDFIYAVEEAVRKGYMNDSGGSYAVSLSDSARQTLFAEGRKIAQEHTKSQQKAVQSRIKGNNSQRKGTVTFEDGIKRSQLNERQQTGVDVLTHIAEETGIDVVFFRSTRDGKGRFNSNFITKNSLSENGQAPNGFWLNGKMYIDVNAGMNGEGLILFTAAHEIVHMIREGSPEQFKALADFLVENYAKKGVDVNKLVLKEMSRSTNLNYDAAYEQVIAQSCESFLRDIHLSDKSEQLYKTDKGLATKIKNILNRIVNAVKKWYDIAKPQSVEAHYVLEMKDAIEPAYDLFIKGFKAAAQNLRNMEKSTEDNQKNMLRDIPSSFEQNINSVAKMDTVVSLTGNEFAKGSVDLITQVTDYFDSIGGVAHSKYGDVRLTRSGVKASIGHGIGRNKAIAFKAVQNVLQDGLMIDYQKNWKQRGYNTAVIAAPITIANTDYYMAAVVIEQAGSNDYYLHEVILKEKENVAAFKTGTVKNGTPSAVTSSIHNILQTLQNSNTSTQKNQSRSDADYLSAVESGDMQTAQRMVDEAAKAAGFNIKAYHQTGDDFTVFDTDSKGAGQNDDETPSGIFLKPTANDIGLKGKKQMPLFVSVSTPLRVGDRQELITHYKKNIEGYAEKKAEIKALDIEYDRKYQEADKREEKAYADLWYKRRTGEISNEQFHKSLEFSETKKIIEEWESEGNKARRELKEMITEYFRNSQYDGVIIESDAGSFGRSVKTYIALDNTQVKSADLVTYDDSGEVIPLSQRFDSTKNDIRYQSRNDIEIAQKTIRDVIERDEYDYYGLRRDNRYYKLNDTVAVSHQWWQDDPNDGIDEQSPYYAPYNNDMQLWDGGELQGTSAVEVTTRNIQQALSRMKMYSPSGDNLYLIAGDNAFKGNDSGEIVIEDAKVLADLSNHNVAESKAKLQGRYSYDSLTAKPDMDITVVDDTKTYESNSNTRKTIVDTAVVNAAKIGYKNAQGNSVVHVDDIDTDIIVSKNGLRHGLDRRLETMAPVTIKAGEILKNAIRVNELTPKSIDISNAYVLIGIAKNTSNEPYIVEFLVNRSTNELTSVDVLYSLNTKTEPAGSLSPGVPALADHLTGSKISIADLLDYVNRYFPDVLPEDVLKHYGYEARPEGAIGKSALYQSRGDIFDIDLFDDDDSIESTFAREYATHHEDIGEVLKNIADIDIEPKKVTAIVNRVIRDNLGSIDAKARELLSTEIQIALENVNREDPETVINEMISAVREAVVDANVTDDRAAANYSDLLAAFKGRKFYLTDEQINQLAERDMTLNDYRKRMFGKITIVSRENAQRSINGGYVDTSELSLEGLYDMLESPEEYLPFSREQWNEYGYDAPYILMETMEKLRDMRTKPMSEVYSEEDIDELTVGLTAKITGAIVEAKYNSKQNPYVSELVTDLKQKRSEAVEKQKEKNKQKLAELKQKERDRAAKREQELRDKYREQRAHGYENRKRTEFRGKIRNLMSSFQSRLTKPRDGSYVPRELISQTVDILNSINMDTGRSINLSEKIAALRNTYDGLKEDAQAIAAYDDTISAMLRGLSDSLGNTSIMEMSLDQLKQTYDTLRSLDHYIRESVKMTDTDEKRTAHQLGREMIAETKAIPKEHSGLLSGYVQSQLRADVMFNRLAGFKKNSTWLQMARMLNDGQLHMTQLQMEFSKIFADVLTDVKQLKTLSDTKHLVDIGLIDDDGNKVPITRGMMISLYMHLLNADNKRHVERGGLTVPSMKEYYRGDLTKAFGSGQRSVRVGMIDFSEYAEGIKTVIEQQLTDYEKLWIGLAHEFFDVASREALNDTTMKLYHFKKANVDNYFPIHTNSNYRAASFESITRDMSLENSGFMKERIKASNPILLEDIVDVINDQIQKVSKYCGMTIPIKNFQKVYSTTLPDYEASVQEVLSKKFSGSKTNTSATKYIDNLITDLTSGRQTSDGPFAKFFSMARGNLAAATLTLNVRVAIAQAASYPTAAAEIGWKPLMKALVRGGKNNRLISRADTDTIAEYTPLLWYRTQGYSNSEIGDIKELRKQSHQIEGKVKKALGWIEFFDGMTVGRLFYAAQYYVDEQYPDLKRGTEEYKQKVAEVYNNVIEKTQPNYTVMQRPDILRNPNALVKSLTMFMTQRLQNFNIIYDAVGTYNKYRQDLTAGKNGVTAADLREAKTKLRRAVVSQTVAAMTIVGMKLFADMLMHSMNGYRDDDDDLTAESVSLALLNNFADTIFGSVLFGSDLYSLLKSAINKEMYYGISLSGVDSLKDALSAIANIWIKGITLDTANKAATTICQVLGLPLKNAEKIGKAIYNWGSDFSSGDFMESGVNRTNKQNIHRAETRYLSGDTAGAKKLLNAMIEQKKSEGKTDKEARSWLRNQLTSTFKPRYLQAIKDNNTGERTAIRQFLYQSGAYGSLTDLDKALSNWVKKAE